MTEDTHSTFQPGSHVEYTHNGRTEEGKVTDVSQLTDDGLLGITVERPDESHFESPVSDAERSISDVDMSMTTEEVMVPVDSVMAIPDSLLTA